MCADIVGVCNVRYGCAVTQINIAVPAFEEYDCLITGGLCFSRLRTCSWRRAPEDDAGTVTISANLRFAVKLCEQTREDDIEHGVCMTLTQFLTGDIDAVRFVHANSARDEMVAGAHDNLRDMIRRNPSLDCSLCLRSFDQHRP